MKLHLPGPLLTLVALTCVPSLGVCADIYRSVAPDGTVRFASERLDPSYERYLSGEPTTVHGASGRAVVRPARQREAQLLPVLCTLATRHGVDPGLVRAIIEVESGFQPQAVSPKGAVGPMQLMADTAARYGVRERTNPVHNIDAGIRHLKHLLQRHGGSVPLALAAYNAGEGAVSRHGKRIPPYRETMLYVPAVMSKVQPACLPSMLSDSNDAL